MNEFDPILEKINIKFDMSQRNDILNNKRKMNPVIYSVGEINEYVEEKFYRELTLRDKVIMAKDKIKEFIENPRNSDQEMMISFSGGKDSCVLRYLVHQVQNDLNTKLSNCLVANEIFHPETINFIHRLVPNAEILPGIKGFPEIIKDFGYPIISKQLAQKISHVRNTVNHGVYIRATLGLDGKNFGVLPLIYVHFLDKKFVDYKISHKCCDYIKGSVKHDKRPVFVGTTIEESRLRKNTWLKYGCNYYTKDKAMCKPLSHWTESDIWNFIRENNIEVSPIYKYDRETNTVNGYKRSGCVACMFGMGLEKEICKRDSNFKNRFEMLYDTNKTAFLAFLLGKSELWKPLADMGVELRNIDNEDLNKKMLDRKNLLNQWYADFDTNFNAVLDEIVLRNPNVFKCDQERDFVFNRYKKVLRTKEQNAH